MLDSCPFPVYTSRMRTVHIHLVSDSTGETVSSIARSVMSQFDGVEAEEHMWSLIRTNGQIDKVIEGIKQHPGIVLYTIISDTIQTTLEQKCKDIEVPCIPALNTVMQQMSQHLGIEIKGTVGRQYVLNEQYFDRIKAIDYALNHDDGQNTHELDEADVVLLGPSRTSKTPTCIYLSYRGIYAANIPIVPEVPLPDALFSLKRPLVLGLLIQPDRLMQIRKSRLLSLNEDRETAYIDIEAIQEEVREARRLFTKHKWKTMDVTRKSIEETTATIIQMIEDRKRDLAKKD